MSLPIAGQPREESVARLPGADASASMALPNLGTTSEAALLDGVRARDPLALAEIYQRTSVTAHAVIRRLLSGVEVDAVLCGVYVDLWTSPPAGQALGSWVRGHSFDLAAAELRRRRLAPVSPSVALLLQDLPERNNVNVLQAERDLATLPETHRRALCLAHDRGVPTSQQDDGAALLVEAALLTLAGDEGQAPGSDAAVDYVLDLLPADEAAAMAAAAADDAVLAARIRLLRRGRHRLEGLPPTANLGHRILAHVLGAGQRVSVSPDTLPVEPGGLEERPSEAAASEERAYEPPESEMTGRVDAPAAAVSDLHPPAMGPPDDALAREGRHRGSVAVPERSQLRAMALLSAAVFLITAANVLIVGSRPLPAANARPTVAAVEAAPRSAQASDPGRRRTADRATPTRKQRKDNKTPRIVAPRAIAPVAPPVNIRIPAMGVDKRLVELGLQPDGRLASPVDYGDPGWYRDGVAPGERGPAVIVGHVDSLDGPAIFYDLKTLKKGDKVMIERADGTKARFVIDRIGRFPKENFPTQQVYGDTARPELRLITCGGGFNNSTRHYDDNVVAFAHMMKRDGGKDHNGDNKKNGAASEASKGSRRSESRPRSSKADASKADASKADASKADAL